MRKEHAAPPRATTKHVAHGTKMTGSAQAITQLTRLGTNVVLARILSPKDFGVVALAVVVTMLLEQIIDLGTGSAIIQRKTVTRALLNGIFALNLFLGVALSAGLFVAAEPLASLMNSAEAAPVMQVLSLAPLLASLGQIHHSLLRRSLRFVEIAVVSSVSAVVNAAVAIIAAVMGAGVWALVFGILAGALAGTVLVWIFDDYRPGVATDIESIRSVWRFSANLFGANVLAFLFGQADKVIIARLLGAAPLGLYALALRTITYPVQSIGNIVGEVVFPAFSRRQDDDGALRSGYVRASRVVALVTFPAMAGLAVVAGPVTDVVFGPQWKGLAPLIWVLAPIGALQSVTMNSAQLLMAKGRTDITFRWTLVYSVVLISAELVGVNWGLIGVAIAYATATVMLTPIGLVLAFRLIGLRLLDYFRSLATQAAITILMAACTALVTAAVRMSGGPRPFELFAGMGAGVVTYTVLLVLARPPALTDALEALKVRRHHVAP